LFNRGWLRGVTQAVLSMLKLGQRRHTYVMATTRLP
jgi:hypothetical protein